jgi:hypothetical protein
MPAIDWVRYKKQQYTYFGFYSTGCVTKNNNTPVFNFTRWGALQKTTIHLFLILLDGVRCAKATTHPTLILNNMIESCGLSEIQSDRFVGYNARLALSVCAGFQTHSSRNQLQD